MTDRPSYLNVLFVDDEADNLDAFVFNCEEFWNTHTVVDPNIVIKGKYQLHNHDAIIVDLVFPQPGKTEEENISNPLGFFFLEWLQRTHPSIPVMVLSAYLTDELRGRIHDKYPKVLCMDKPLDFSRAEFRQLIEDFIEDYRRGTYQDIKGKTLDAR